MANSFAMLAVLSALPLAASHGMLTKPRARQLLLGGQGSAFGVGITNPGAGNCDLSGGNGMNMNGCQGAGGVIDFQGGCWVACAGQLGSLEAACVSCKREKAEAYRATLNPSPKLGACGDLYWRSAFSTNFSTDVCEGFPGTGSCIEKALQQPFSGITLGADNSFEVELVITAHHWGWSEFRLCREGGMGHNGEGVTQECFNQDVLRFDAAESAARYTPDKMTPGLAAAPQSPSDYIGTHPSVRCDGPGDVITNSAKLEFPEIWAPEGSCCNQGGDCGDSNVSNTQNIRWVFPNPAAAESAYKLRLFLPPGVSCSQAAPCTLQWTFMTGNSRDSYPEAFRNCADFKIAGSSSSGPTTPTTNAPTAVPTAVAPTTASTNEPEPEPEPEPTATTVVPTAVTSTVAPAGSSCVPAPAYAAYGYDTYCASQANCQAPHCMSTNAVASTTAAPATTAAASPTTTTVVTTAAPTTTSASSGGAAACEANPSSNQVGVDDSACAPCATGQTWWPCNVVGLCICQSTSGSHTSTTAAVTPVPAPAPTGGATGSYSPCDDGSESSCKRQCSRACGDAVATNQCWGTPRYVECKCSDQTIFQFDGCACENGLCGASAALVEGALKAHKAKVRKHRFLAGDHVMIQRIQNMLKGKRSSRVTVDTSSAGSSGRFNEDHAASVTDEL